MISDPGDATCIAAATAPFESLIGRRFSVAGHNAETVLRSRQMLAIEDGSTDQTIHEQLRQLVRIGSMLYLPLFESDGKPLGLMLLIRHTVGAFSEEQLRLAQIFATRAAGAIESARLYQQTRRDADTKAMLLRELNHRVKNNLAGIVGLLSTRPRDLEFPPAARQWLERVTDRISIMGRAHELFVGGPQTVGLEELIDQLLPTLSIVKPAGVRISKDLHGLSVTLTTERAIALAMVLHELCCNAIAHGIGQQGTIVIRARAQDSGIVIEVADDGSREQTAQIDNRSAPMIDLKPQPFQQSVAERDEERGWGLRLVEGLVTRELRGRFSMSSRLEPPRGTVARVELPINGEIEGSRNP
jgi:two-component sensor histidine kinase